MNVLVTLMVSLLGPGFGPTQLAEAAGSSAAAQQLAAHPTLNSLREELNQARAVAGLPALERNNGLVVAAQTHAWAMAHKHTLEHNLSGDPATRARQVGFDAPVGECIARGARSVGAALGTQGSAGWLNTDQNRAELLRADATDVGFGYAVDDRGQTYWVAMVGVVDRAQELAAQAAATDEADVAAAALAAQPEATAESDTGAPTATPEPEATAAAPAAATPAAATPAAATPAAATPGAAAPAEAAAPPVAARPAIVQLMSPDRLARFRRLLPKVADDSMQAVLDDPRLMLYTDAEMPKAYQFFDGAFPGVHAANYNISANGSEPFGNGNREFPWAHPAGTHRTTNVNTFRFLWLPLDESGKVRPIVWCQKVLSGGGRPAYSWTFPVGAVVGEVLFMRGSDGHDYTFELRLRKREVGQWNVDVFRPFPTAEDLARRIRELRPEWNANPALVRSVDHLQRKVELPLMRLVDFQPQQRVIDESMGVDVLPSLEDDKLVTQLLTQTPFHSAMGVHWRPQVNGKTTAAPTTRAPFHVIPASYDAGFVEVDRFSCMRCHETVNTSVRRFNAGRDWYGRIRGADGIFSFHPFATESISGNGFSQQVHMRRELEAGGILEEFRARRHARQVYHRVDRLE